MYVTKEENQQGRRDLKKSSKKRKKKKIDMMNRRISLENNPNPIIEDTAVHPINPAQEKRKHSLERPSISTIVV